jgi:hypothetical protein
MHYNTSYSVGKKYHTCEQSPEFIWSIFNKLRLYVLCYKTISHFDSSSTLVIKFYIIDDRFHVCMGALYMFEFRRPAKRWNNALPALQHCQLKNHVLYNSHSMSLINHVLYKLNIDYMNSAIVRKCGIF